MEKIIAPDGTPIACTRTGAGPPLILVHGTGGSAARWTAVQPALGAKFTVYAVDRRGRGASGDSTSYSIEREFEDIAAVVDSVGESVNLLGHSFGALCALEAARLTRNIRKLILYEPPISFPDAPVTPVEVIDRLQARLDAGDREGVLDGLYRDTLKMTPEQIEQVRSSPAWPARLAAAHTLPREMRAQEKYQFKAERFRGVHFPTLLLLGSDSPPVFKRGIEALDSGIPHSRIVILPGQQHTAMDTAPELFVREVMTFLNES